MKRISRFLISIMAFAVIISMASVINTDAATKKSKDKVTSTLKKGVLTIKGKGKMPSKMKFKNNKKIKKVVIKKGVTSISNSAFDGCKNLKEVKIANTVKEIGWYSFRNTAIKEITIPKSVKTMGNGVLINCNKLTTITMPGNFKQKIYPKSVDGMFSIGYGKKIKTINFNTSLDLKLCEYLMGINWNVSKKDSNYKSIDGVIYSKDGKEIVRVPSGRTEVTLDDGCETFCLQSIFYGQMEPDQGEYPCCNKLKKITIPSSVKYIEDKKYKGTYEEKNAMSLTEIVVEGDNLDSHSVVTLISNFIEITNIEDVSKHNFDIEYFAKLFEKRIALADGFYVLDNKVLLCYTGDETNIVVPEYITEIGASAFKGIAVKSVVLPEGLEKIGEEAFYGKKISEIKLPENLKEIDDRAFAFSNLRNIEIPKGIEKWGEYVFENSFLEKVVLPDNMTNIPKGMFCNCWYLTDINIPVNLKKLSKDALYFTKIDVQKFINNKSLNTINEGALGNTDWTKLTIPTHINKIGKSAITSIKEGEKNIVVEGVADKFQREAFWKAVDYKNIYVEYKQGIKKSYVCSKIINFEDSKVYIQWTNVKNVDGYEIRVCSDKKYKKVIKKVTKKKRKTSAKIKINKKYSNLYVKIRPYKLVDGKKVYGRWSKEKV